jgi:hypothetical protein
MKTIIILITLIIATTTISCEKDTTIICENLLEQGMPDPPLLVGEWELQYFARTLDGINYKWEDSPSFKSYLTFFDSSKYFETKIINAMSGDYDIIEQSNYISFNPTVITQVGVTEEQAAYEENFFNSIKNSICFVIVDNIKLLIHYKEDKDRKNIMIFNKKEDQH